MDSGFIGPTRPEEKRRSGLDPRADPVRERPVDDVAQHERTEKQTERNVEKRSGIEWKRAEGSGKAHKTLQSRQKL